MTNFERITKSPEELAEFVMSQNIEYMAECCSWCKHGHCSECDWSCYKCLLKWLKEKSEESEEIQNTNKDV